MRMLKKIFAKIFKKHWVILDKHNELCRCSYCTNKTHWYGFKFPKLKVRNAWTIFAWKLNECRWYLRWTG